MQWKLIEPSFANLHFRLCLQQHIRCNYGLQALDADANIKLSQFDLLSEEDTPEDITS